MSVGFLSGLIIWHIVITASKNIGNLKSWLLRMRNHVLIANYLKIKLITIAPNQVLMSVGAIRL